MQPQAEAPLIDHSGLLPLGGAAGQPSAAVVLARGRGALRVAHDAGIRTVRGIGVRCALEADGRTVRLETDLGRGELLFAAAALRDERGREFRAALALLNPASDFELQQLQYMLAMYNEMRARQQQADYKDIHKTQAANLVGEICSDQFNYKAFAKASEQICDLVARFGRGGAPLQQDTVVKQRTLQLFKQSYNQIILERVCFLIYNIKEFHAVYEFVYKQSVNTGIMAEKTVERLSITNSLTNKALNQINVQQINLYFVKQMLKLIYALDQFILTVHSRNNKLFLFEHSCSYTTSTEVLQQLVSIMLNKQLDAADARHLAGVIKLQYVRPEHCENDIVDYHAFYRQRLAHTHRDRFRIAFFVEAVHAHIRESNYFALPDDIAARRQLYQAIAGDAGGRGASDGAFYGALARYVLERYDYRPGAFCTGQFADYVLFGLLASMLLNVDKQDTVYLGGYQLLASERQLSNAQQLRRLQGANQRHLNTLLAHVLQYLQKRNIQRHLYQNILQITYRGPAGCVQRDSLLQSRGLQALAAQDRRLFELYLVLFVADALFIRGLLQLTDLLRVNIAQAARLEAHRRVLVAGAARLGLGDRLAAARCLQQFWAARRDRPPRGPAGRFGVFRAGVVGV